MIAKFHFKHADIDVRRESRIKGGAYHRVDFYGRR